MAIQEKQLGQLRPANATAASLYSPGASTTTIIKSIVVCNVTASDLTFRLFLDDNGTTYDETTALFYDTIIEGNSTVQVDTYYAMNNTAGNLAFRSSSGNALTATCSGAEIT